MADKCVNFCEFVIGGDGWDGATNGLYLALVDWARRNNFDPPILLSACRPATLQKELQERWDRGDREGLAVRPADPTKSKHVPKNGTCKAFDLGNSPQWLALAGAYVTQNFPRATWGGFWLRKDPGHFET